MATVMTKTLLIGAEKVRLMFDARKMTVIPLEWNDF